jgi:murein DD-endopeptidase MepM/ murein hydrolase activator NlpD
MFVTGHLFSRHYLLIGSLFLALSLLMPEVAVNAEPEDGITSASSHFEDILNGVGQPQSTYRFLNPPKLPPLDPSENLEHITYRTGLKEGLDKILASLGLSAGESRPWLASIRKQYPAARLTEGKELHFYFAKTKATHVGANESKQLKALEIAVNADKVLTWEKGLKGIVFAKRENSYEVEQVSVRGTIENAFVEDALRAGLNPTLLSQLVDIFSWELDFASDLQKGDSFKLIYEKRFGTGKNDSVSFRILAADVSSGGQDYGAIYFEGENGRGKYYDLNGRSLARAFLRFPLEFIGISSFFSHSRFHPVLKTERPHNGVDFMAKRGTPVRAVGDGRVLFSGWKNGGYGRTIDIEHDSTFSSRYAHLQSLARGVTKGAAVRKGQVIGYVGSSGRTTGPHLHFEFYRDQIYVDPLKVEFPAEDEIEPSLQRRFENTKRFFSAQMYLNHSS